LFGLHNQIVDLFLDDESNERIKQVTARWDLSSSSSHLISQSSIVRMLQILVVLFLCWNSYHSK
jgi:hypothetical protein